MENSLDKQTTPLHLKNNISVLRYAFVIIFIIVLCIIGKLIYRKYLKNKRKVNNQENIKKDSPFENSLGTDLLNKMYPSLPRPAAPSAAEFYVPNIHIVPQTSKSMHLNCNNEPIYLPMYPTVKKNQEKSTTEKSIFDLPINENINETSI